MVQNEAIGVLLLDTPPVPGDRQEVHVRDLPGTLGSDETFSFPLIRRVVPRATPERVMAGDKEIVPQFIKTAKLLEEEGVAGITSNCGYTALFQREVARAASVPVFLSSLILVPLVYRVIPGGKAVGIITFDSRFLSEKHFEGADWSSRDIPVTVLGLEGLDSWTNIAEKRAPAAERMGADLTDRVVAFKRTHPEIGALVLECTLALPHGSALRQATGLPVFDVVSLTELIFTGVSTSRLSKWVKI